MKIGENIDGYDLIDEILGGGMADVYVVKKSNVKYALKTIKDSASEDDIKRFKREVRMLMTITDNNVIEVVDSDLDCKSPYYIMPLCDDSLHNKCKTMSEQDKIEYSVQFCKGILAIHNNEITHRDIKPQNALFINDTLKVTDLGLGRFSKRDTVTLTKTGQYGYTAGYMPPEYLTDNDSFKNGTYQGDIYMVGKTLYYVFSGGSCPSNIQYNKVHPFISGIISKCIQENPIYRYANMNEIISELSIYKQSLEIFKHRPLSLEEIRKKHNYNVTPQYGEDIYKYLCFIGTDNKLMVEVIRQLDTNNITYIFTQKKDELNGFLDYFVASICNCDSWIQFADVEIFVKFAGTLIPLCTDLSKKQTLLNFAIDLSRKYNRWPAMKIIGDILSRLTKAEVIALHPYLISIKTTLIDISSHFEVELPIEIKMIIRG